MRTIIFANGELHDTPRILAAIRAEDVIIAADGGAAHCLRLGLRPAAVIGDLDSLPANDLATASAAGAETIRFPPEKDFTDLELALRHAAGLGADEILVFGALGRRWDQTLANLLLPAGEQYANCRIWLMDGPQAITLLHGGQTLHIEGQPGDTVSLIPIGGAALQVTAAGLQYPLNGETLWFAATRGVSNRLLQTHASIQLGAGLLVCVLIHGKEIL